MVKCVRVKRKIFWTGLRLRESISRSGAPARVAPTTKCALKMSPPNSYLAQPLLFLQWVSLVQKHKMKVISISLEGERGCLQ